MFQKSDQNKRVRCYITLFWFDRLVIPFGEFAFQKLMHVRFPLFGFPTLPRCSRYETWPTAFNSAKRTRGRHIGVTADFAFLEGNRRSFVDCASAAVDITHPHPHLVPGFSLRFR